jgi:hypothetical protein
MGDSYLLESAKQNYKATFLEKIIDAKRIDNQYCICNIISMDYKCNLERGNPIE